MLPMMTLIGATKLLDMAPGFRMNWDHQKNPTGNAN